MNRNTPKKSISTSEKKKIIDDALAKDLFISPFKDAYTANLFPLYTPIKQPEYLLSPSPVKNDLFSQLLITETKQTTPLGCEESIAEQEISQEQESLIEQSNMQNQSSQNFMSDQSQLNQSSMIEGKKRKRKSTAQIKILKQAMDGEMNWPKQKINKMAQITGLSQSQVYKWCWDQKKKQNKNKQNHLHCFDDRRKLIKKDIRYRSYLNPRRNIDEDQYQKPSKQCMKNPLNRPLNRESVTKQKTSFTINEKDFETQKKLNKRLIFN